MPKIDESQMPNDVHLPLNRSRSGFRGQPHWALTSVYHRAYLVMCAHKMEKERWFDEMADTTGVGDMTIVCLECLTRLIFMFGSYSSHMGINCNMPRLENQHLNDAHTAFAVYSWQWLMLLSCYSCHVELLQCADI